LTHDKDTLHNLTRQDEYIFQLWIHKVKVWFERSSFFLYALYEKHETERSLLLISMIYIKRRDNLLINMISLEREERERERERERVYVYVTCNLTKQISPWNN
jgi:hypothetical protein